MLVILQIDASEIDSLRYYYRYVDKAIRIEPQPISLHSLQQEPGAR